MAYRSTTSPESQTSRARGEHPRLNHHGFPVLSHLKSVLKRGFSRFEYTAQYANPMGIQSFRSSATHNHVFENT